MNSGFGAQAAPPTILPIVIEDNNTLPSSLINPLVQEGILQQRLR